jgi:hypothetical protein
MGNVSLFTKRSPDGQIKLANWFKIVASTITILIMLGGTLWGTFTYLDNTFVKAEEIKVIETRIETNTVNTFEKQQKILDIRYLEQLQCQKALMEKELERDPNDRLIEDKLERIKRTIERVEDQIYTQ